MEWHTLKEEQAAKFSSMMIELELKIEKLDGWGECGLVEASKINLAVQYPTVAAEEKMIDKLVPKINFAVQCSTVAAGKEMIDKLVRDPRLSSGVPCTGMVGEKEMTDGLGPSTVLTAPWWRTPPCTGRPRSMMGIGPTVMVRDQEMLPRLSVVIAGTSS